MKSFIIGSMDYSAGKTSLIVGLARSVGKPFGYIKPLGDRLVYRKKRIWDYDAALMTNIFSLGRDPEEMTMGFEHLKMRFKYDEEGAKNRVADMVKETGAGKDIMFVESGKSIEYGVSFHLNAFSLAKYLGGKLVIVVSGDENYVIDNAIFIKKYLDLHDLNFGGIIINKVRNIDDFNNVYVPIIKGTGIEILGVVPFIEQLTFFSMEYLAQYLLARVLAGESWLEKRVSNIFVGAASVDSAYVDEKFRRENTLLITSGDRSDMLLASFEEGSTAAVVVTNNILPPQNILAKADERKIPVLLVPFGVYEAAKQIEALTPLITSKNTAEIDLMAKMVGEHVNVGAILKDLSV
ncbi:MAG: AAA family ATPase [Dehalococcoidia bacterium]